MLDSLTLIFPRLKYRTGDPPLGICYIAGHLKNIYPELNIKILDSTFHNSFKTIRNHVRNNKPQAIGIYVDTVMYNPAKKLLKELRKNVPLIIAGGPHATISPQSLFEVADIVVKGEAEQTMADLIRELPEGSLKDISGIYFKNNGRVFQTSGEIKRPALDELEIPALGLLDNIEHYIRYWHYLDPLSPKYKGLNVMASRGCIFNCSYCQPTLKKLFGENLRYKSPQYLITELKYYIKNFKVNNFFFHDDTLTTNKRWMDEFCTLILENNLNIKWGCNSRIDTVDREMLEIMHRAGLRVIHYGIESGSQRILDEVYNKGIQLENAAKIINLTRNTGIHPSGFFMIGAPTESVKEMFKTIILSWKLKLAEASFSLTTPFIGTHLYEKIKNNSNYKIANNFSEFDYYCKVSLHNKNTLNFIPSLLQKIGIITFYSSCLRWKYIFKHLISFRGIRKLVNKIARFI